MKKQAGKSTMKKQAGKNTMNRRIYYDVYTPPPSSVPFKQLDLYALDNGAIIAIEFPSTKNRSTKDKRSAALKKLFSTSKLVKGNLTSMPKLVNSNLTKIKDELEEYFSGNLQEFTIQKEFKEYFSGKRQKFTIPWELHGTSGQKRTCNQKRVWEELLKIPYGEVFSYKEIATKVGESEGAQAVGKALGANPISIVIPCHRVLETSQSTRFKYELGKYSGGGNTKKRLLNLEGAYNTNSIKP